MPARTKTTRFYSRWKPRTADEFWSGTCARLKGKKKASLSRVTMFSRAPRYDSRFRHPWFPVNKCLAPKRKRKKKIVAEKIFFRSIWIIRSGKERKEKEREEKGKKMYSSIDGEKLTNDEVKLLEVVRREWNESKNWFMRGRNERRQRLDRKWFYAVIWLKIRETGMMDRSNLLERDSIESVN